MKRNKSRIARYWMWLAVFAVFISVAVPVFAYFIKQSGTVTNEFTPAGSVLPEIKEDFAGNKTVKTNVKVNVGNTGYPVYVRAEILITWQDKNGIVYYTKPDANADYTLSLNNADWVQGSDGYYYYKQPVASGGTTTNLIDRCVQSTGVSAPEGYQLSVEIIAQTVQAIGKTDGENSIDAVKDAWGASAEVGS